MKEAWEKMLFEYFYNFIDGTVEDFRNQCEWDCVRKYLRKGMKYYDIEPSKMSVDTGFRYANYDAISLMSESTIAYLVLNDMLTEVFYYPTLCWEYPYPNNPELKAALGVLDEDGKLDSLIEFKKWTSADGREIKQCVDKYKLCDSDCIKYLCVVQQPGGKIEDDIEFLLRENPELEVLYKESTKSWFQNVEVPVHVYLLKM